MPKFEKTYCSQCGGEFGPGNSGYSHCSDHRTMQACSHPIWRYLGADFWGSYDDDGRAIREQRHECIDCGKQERDVPENAVMIGHAPGECSVCDKYAEIIPPEQRARWIEMTERRRA